jgi:20S proteasome subunit beta 3
LADRVYVGMAGFQSDAQTVMEKLLFQKELYELRENRKLSPTVAATLISNLLYKHRFGGYMVGPIVAGLDPITNKSYVAGTDSIGSICAPGDFSSTGCASEYVLNLCESNIFKLPYFLY